MQAAKISVIWNKGIISKIILKWRKYHRKWHGEMVWRSAAWHG